MFRHRYLIALALVIALTMGACVPLEAPPAQDGTASEALADEGPPERGAADHEGEAADGSVSVTIVNNTKVTIQLTTGDGVIQEIRETSVVPGAEWSEQILLAKDAAVEPVLDLATYIEHPGSDEDKIELRFAYADGSGIEGCTYTINRPDGQPNTFDPRGSYHLNSEAPTYTSTINQPYGRYTISFEIIPESE